MPIIPIKFAELPSINHGSVKYFTNKSDFATLERQLVSKYSLTIIYKHEAT